MEGCELGAMRPASQKRKTLASAASRRPRKRGLLSGQRVLLREAKLGSALRSISHNLASFDAGQQAGVGEVVGVSRCFRKGVERRHSLPLQRLGQRSEFDNFPFSHQMDQNPSQRLQCILLVVVSRVNVRAWRAVPFEIPVLDTVTHLGERLGRLDVANDVDGTRRARLGLRNCPLPIAVAAEACGNADGSRAQQGDGGNRKDVSLYYRTPSD